jgi:two-component system, chemotaxis family, CheB/CheR fusion protein
LSRQVADKIFRPDKHLGPTGNTKISKLQDKALYYRTGERQTSGCPTQPTAVLFNEKLEAVYFHGSTDKYLQPPAGDANWNILGMAGEGLKLELANAIRKAASKKPAIRIERIRAKSNGGYIWVNLTVRPVSEDGSERGAMIAVFGPISPKSPAPPAEPHSLGQSELRDRITQLEHELASAKEYLQTTIEEVETSNEELKSTNEELQSVNEELITVNSELQQKKSTPCPKRTTI